VPAIYADRRYVTSGGLVSYDADRTDIFRRTASYVDRVLRGEKPGDLPFQHDQPQNRQGSRPYRANYAARDRRRGDRMSRPMSASGPKQHP
jgi:ABC transporter substrate binding protein